MSKDQQPDALWIAEVLEQECSDISQSERYRAASELRRLHAENESLRADARRLDFITADGGAIRTDDRGGLSPNYIYWWKHREGTRTPREAIDEAIALRKEGA